MATTPLIYAFSAALVGVVAEHQVMEGGPGLPVEEEIGLGEVDTGLLPSEDVRAAWRARFPTLATLEPLHADLEAGRGAILQACAALPEVPPGPLADPRRLARATTPIRMCLGYWIKCWRALSSLQSVISYATRTRAAEIPGLDPKDPRLARFNSLRRRIWATTPKAKEHRAEYDAQPEQLDRRQRYMASKRADPAYREAENQRARERRAARRAS
jgi:hypothetical protein